MREYDHLVQNGEIIWPDPNSLKAEFGLHTPEAYDPNDPRFLQEATVSGLNGLLHAFIVAPESSGILTDRGYSIGEGKVVVELEGEGGGYTLARIHNSWLQNG